MKNLDRAARHRQRECDYAYRTGPNPFRRLTTVERVKAHRGPEPQGVVRATARPRGRRPKAQSTRSSAKSGDSGDDGPGEPEAAPAVPVEVAA